MGNIPSQNEVLKPLNLLILAISLYGIRFVRRIFQTRTALAKVGNLPGGRAVYGPFSLGRILPTIPYITRKPGWQFSQKYGLHEKYGFDIVTNVFLFNSTRLYLIVADPNVIKQITTNRIEFPKPLKMYKLVSVFGPNIVAAEFDEWKRHRKIAAPSFSEKNNRLVFEETTRITSELFEYWGRGEVKVDNVVTLEGGRVVKVDNVVTFTSRLALMVISAAGFGSRLAWDEMEQAPAGHEMTFQTALTTVLNNFVFRLLFSDHILKFWKRGRQVMIAFKELRVYMREMIEERKQLEGAEGQSDLFTNLINGTSVEEEKDVDQLSDEELMGNVFIFLFAGHETTAHSLGFSLALLATHQDVQEKAYQELRKIVPENEALTYAHVVKWAYGLAITYESLRMYPPVTGFPKTVAHDTVFTTCSADGKTQITVPVPQDTYMIMNVTGLHYNPKYWGEPKVFRPERFLGDYNRDAFIPFSAGPRSCIGRRFSEIEAVTFLAHLILKYQFTGTPISENETQEEMKERLLRWHLGTVTLSPEKVPLTFTLRS